MQVRIALFSTLAFLPALRAQNDWPVYGHDLTNQRYSTLSQINTNNAGRLVQAWIFNANPNPSPSPGGRGARPGFGYEGTPLVVNGVMYLVSSFQGLVALDPETGKQIWVFSHKHSGRPPRGAAYWPGDKDNPAEICSAPSTDSCSQ